MGNGYWERILRVDLSARTVQEETVSENVWRKVLGGAGYGAKVLHEEVGKKLEVWILKTGSFLDWGLSKPLTKRGRLGFVLYLGLRWQGFWVKQQLVQDGGSN